MPAAQDFAELTQEYQQGIDDQRYRRRAQGAPTRAATPAPKRPPFPAAEVLKLYISCLRSGLQVRAVGRSTVLCGQLQGVDASLVQVNKSEAKVEHNRKTPPQVRAHD